MLNILRRCLVAVGIGVGALIAAPLAPAEAASLVQTVQYYGPPRGYYRGPPPRFYGRPYRRPYVARPFYGPRPGYYGRPLYHRPYGRRFYR